MATTKRNLPRRFQPYAQQAAAETALRYGGQQDALGLLARDALDTFNRRVAAQNAAAQGLAGYLANQAPKLDQAYTDAGLTPEVRAQIANSPTGQLLARSLGDAQSELTQRGVQAKTGAVFGINQAGQDYRDAIGKINAQGQSLSREAGLFQSQLLDQLIGEDRSRRHDANEKARQQQFELDRDAIENANDLTRGLAQGFVTQGIMPVIGPDGSVSPGKPIPGGKADPNSPQNRSKRKPKAASPATIRDATGTYGSILPYVRAMWKSGINRHAAGQALLRGRKGEKGEKVYDPNTRQPVINPDGTQKTTRGKSEIPSFKGDLPLLKAALDSVYDGHVSPNTVKMLRKAYGSGIVNALPGVTKNRHAPRPRQRRANPQGVFANPVRPPRIR